MSSYVRKSTQEGGGVKVGVTHPKFTNDDFVGQISITGRADSAGKPKNKG